MASASLLFKFARFSTSFFPSLNSAWPSRIAANARRQAISALPPPPPSSGRALPMARPFHNISRSAADKFLGANSLTDFVRFKRCETTGLLQTAVVRYRKRFPSPSLDPSLQVDLVSVAHLADKQYFEILQRGLEHYDCVLYEMVASRKFLKNRLNSRSKGKLKYKISGGFSVIGFIHRKMARILSLDHQVECLDYGSEKWQHADLDYETFKLLQGVRGESFFALAKEMALRATETLTQPVNIPSNLGLWKAKLLWASHEMPMPLVGVLIIRSVCSPFEKEYSELEALSRLDIVAALKIFMAKMLTSDEFTETVAAILEKSVILHERNIVAVEALRRAIDRGHQRIAVLYGAGHMPDLDRRLREEFDMIPSDVQWITAWCITKKRFYGQSLPFLKALAKRLHWHLNRNNGLALLIFSSVLALDLSLWGLFAYIAVKLAFLLAKII